MKIKDDVIGKAKRDIKEGEVITIALSEDKAVSDAIKFNKRGVRYIHQKVREYISHI